MICVWFRNACVCVIIFNSRSRMQANRLMGPATQEQATAEAAGEKGKKAREGSLGEDNGGGGASRSARKLVSPWCPLPLPLPTLLLRTTLLLLLSVLWLCVKTKTKTMLWDMTKKRLKKTKMMLWAMTEQRTNEDDAMGYDSETHCWEIWRWGYGIWLRNKLLRKTKTMLWSMTEKKTVQEKGDLENWKWGREENIADWSNMIVDMNENTANKKKEGVWVSFSRAQQPGGMANPLCSCCCCRCCCCVYCWILTLCCSASLIRPLRQASWPIDECIHTLSFVRCLVTREQTLLTIIMSFEVYV